MSEDESALYEETTVYFKSNVKKGDEVHAIFHFLNLIGQSTDEDEEYEASDIAAVDDDGVIYLQNYGVRLDRMVSSALYVHGTVGIEFKYAKRTRKLSKTDTYWKSLHDHPSNDINNCNLSDPDVLTLFKKKDGTIWFMTRDNHPFLLHDKNGNVIQSTFRQLSNHVGFPGGASNYIPFKVRLDNHE